MVAKVKHKYLGVVLRTQEKVIIEATTQEAATKEMKKLHGEQYEGMTTNWVVGRQPGD